MAIGLVKIMNNAPQSVTERYVSNLIHAGRNRDFDIIEIHRKYMIDPGPEGDHIGFYFQVTILKGCIDNGENRRIASGATITQAARRCLEKHGVTFR